MGKRTTVFVVLMAVGAFVVAACGGGSSATGTPVQATQPAATPTRAAPTPTQPAPGTTTVAPTAAATTVLPTPTPSSTIPTPIVHQPAKRGGTLRLPILSCCALTSWDTFITFTEFVNVGPALNNLIWPDPYGPGTLSGDIAQTWDFSQEGKVITFKLRPGIKFHDGTTLTSKDVLYNLNRAWQPTEARAVLFKTRMAVIQSLDAPDDFTVRITLKNPSNIFLQSLSHPGMLMYPSTYPFPDRRDTWKQSMIGTGPFKPIKIQPEGQLEFVKNDAYFKPGMPYVDGAVFTFFAGDTLNAAYKAGRVDASILIGPSAIEKELEKSLGWNIIRGYVSVLHVTLNNKPPFHDIRVRQAINLAMDREAMVAVWAPGGDRRVASMLPREFGGQWGISVKEMETRPGYALDKTTETAQAKDLIKQSGINPSSFELQLVTNSAFQNMFTVLDQNLRTLGFKTSLLVPDQLTGTDKQLRGDFDITAQSPTFSFDDPGDTLSSNVTTGGSGNFGKWSVPRLDQLLNDQDVVLDQARRKQMVTEAQQIILDQLFYIPMMLRFGNHGHMPWVKNYPTNMLFTYSPHFRWEQVWLER